MFTPIFTEEMAFQFINEAEQALFLLPMNEAEENYHLRFLQHLTTCISPAVLERLSYIPLEQVHALISKNEHTPVYILTHLSHSPSVTIRKALATNTELTIEVKEALATSREPIVRQTLAMNPTVSTALLLKLKEDDNRFVHLTAVSALSQRLGRNHSLLNNKEQS